MKQVRYTPITMTNYRLKPNLLLTCAAENPCLSCLILTQILQTEVKSQMSALNKRLQREPAFPDGSPARRAIMGACQIATQAGYLRPEGAHRHACRRAATQLRQDGQHQRLNHLLSWALGVLPSHRTHLQQAHGQRGQQTRASASGRQLGALAVPRCDTHF